MPENDKKKLTISSVSNLLRILSINNVYYIDDYFEEKIDVEPIIGWLSDIADNVSEDIRRLFPEIPFESSYDVWTPIFISNWRHYSTAEQRVKTIDLANYLKKNLSQDQGIVDSLPGLFPQETQPSLLSPSNWEIRKEEIINKANPDNRVLCFFDQDLSLSNGFAEDGPRSGIGLIKEIIDRQSQDNVICCLLTRTITSIDNEIDQWQALSEKYSINLCDFLPLAKLRIHEDDPIQFVDGLKKALLNIPCEKWKNKTIEVFKESTDKACKNIKSIDVYDFDHMIFEISLTEGITESEILMRLFQIYQKDNIHKQFLSQEIKNDLAKLANLSRQLSDIETLKNTPTSKTRDLRRNELYETSELIVNSPITNGDIFSDETGDPKFILLAQPCDLVIRSMGTNLGKRSNKSNSVSLLPIVKISQKEFEKIRTNELKKIGFLEYLYKNSTEIGKIIFSDANTISLDILDLAVFNSTGNCVFDKSKPFTPNSNYTKGWNTRAENLSSQYIEESKRLESVKRHCNRVKNRELKKILLDMFIESKSFSEGIFNFKLQRILRLRFSTSEKLLKSYTHFLSRDADDVDFAKEID